MSRERPLVHLVDGHAYIFRSYFSLPPMEGEDGTPCNAAYGFANTLIGYFAQKRPTHFAVTFDHGFKTFRHSLDPNYKSNRPPAPEDLVPQFELCAQVAAAFGIPVYQRAGFEADDLLATLATQLVRKGADVVLVTADKDLSQLIREDGRITRYDLARARSIDADAVREQFGVSPHQIPDYFGLVGDAIDCIPGVPGIGAKSAATLLQRFGSLAAIPESISDWDRVELRGAARVAELLAKYRAQAELSRELSTVCRTVPELKVRLHDLQYRGASGEQFGELAARLGWREIAMRVPCWRDGCPAWLK